MSDTPASAGQSVKAHNVEVTGACDMSETAKAMAAIAALPEILRAAQTLERAGLLEGETAADVVRRYLDARPEIRAALARVA